MIYIALVIETRISYMCLHVYVSSCAVYFSRSILDVTKCVIAASKLELCVIVHHVSLLRVSPININGAFEVQTATSLFFSLFVIGASDSDEGLDVNIRSEIFRQSLSICS